jgi:hypothetical protein
MAHTYNFLPSQRKTVETCVLQAQAALDKAYKNMLALQRKGVAGTLIADYERWFGTFGPKNLARVTEVIGLMDFALNSGRITFEYNQGCGATTNAVAFTPTHGWKTAKLKETLQSGTFRISLCPRFFGAMPQDAQDRQSRTGTFIHELSHIVGNTNDIAQNHLGGAPITDAPAGFTFYGRDAARLLADRFPNFAIENAENYGFYATWIMRSTATEEVDLSGAFTQLFG